MANPLRDLFSNITRPRRGLVEGLTPRRTFSDVILPPATRRALEHALTQIRKHDLIFDQWGLAERHDTGLGLAFNFAGPPGTGKTICAEAIANTLDKRLLVVRYSEMESMWVGETGKNVSAVFRLAEEQDAVLFFDEADAIASRRFTSVSRGYEREANTVVNVLLRELEEFDGVVIFATNLAANFDPAFERRIRAHILFEQPGIEEREQIWRVQLHARKTPLAADVDFRQLAELFEVSGGDIKNAVLKAAQLATAEPGPDGSKKIHQRHFILGMEDVLTGKRVMEQTLFPGTNGADPLAALTNPDHPLGRLSSGQEALEEEVGVLAQRLVEVEDIAAQLPDTQQALERLVSAQDDLQARLAEAAQGLEAYRTDVQEALRTSEAGWKQQGRTMLYVAIAALLLAIVALVVAVV